MAKKEYKNGSKRYIVGTDGYRRNRKNVQNWNNKYKAETYKRIALLVRKDDTEVIEKLESVESKNAYIIDLIRKDIKASKD